MHNLTNDQIVEIFEEACEILSNENSAEVREEYSGRGMGGRSKPAIVSDANPMKVSLAITQAYHFQYNQDGDIDFCELTEIMPMRIDSMGLSTVYY